MLRRGVPKTTKKRGKEIIIRFMYDRLDFSDSSMSMCMCREKRAGFVKRSFEVTVMQQHKV